jgi:hypothetical protein
MVFPSYEELLNAIDEVVTDIESKGFDCRVWALDGETGMDV